MDKREEKLQIAEVAGTWFTVIAVLFGGLFGIIEYIEYKETQRVDRALEFVSRYQSNDNFIDAHTNISLALDENLPKISTILKNPELSEVDLSVAYSSEILTMIENETLGPALEQLFNFYEQALMCKEMELCEAIVLENFLDNDAGSYTRTFYPYICSLREGWNNPKVFERVTNFYIGSSDKLCR